MAICNAAIFDRHANIDLGAYFSNENYGEVLRLLLSGSIFVSQTSLLEIAIKQSIGKLPELPISILELEEVLRRDGFQLIPIANVHIDAYNAIPLLNSIAIHSIDSSWLRHTRSECSLFQPMKTSAFIKA